jgi:hypothetical protein
LTGWRAVNALATAYGDGTVAPLAVGKVSDLAIEGSKQLRFWHEPVLHHQHAAACPAAMRQLPT